MGYMNPGKTFKELVTFHPSHAGSVRALLGKGDILYSAGDDGQVVAWDVRTCKRLLTMSTRDSHKGGSLVHEYQLNDVQVENDLCFVAAEKGRVHSFTGMFAVMMHTVRPDSGAPGPVYEAPRGVAVRTLHLRKRTLYVGGTNGYLAAWDIKRHTQLARFCGHGTTTTIFSIFLLEETKKLYSGDDAGEVCSHHTDSVELERAYPGHVGEVSILHFMRSEHNGPRD